MAYNGGCLIGVETKYDYNVAGLFGPPTSFGAASSMTGAIVNPWQNADGCWTPSLFLSYGSATNLGRHTWVALLRAAKSNALLLARQQQRNIAETKHFYAAASVGDPFVSVTPQTILSINEAAVGQAAKYLVMDDSWGSTAGYYCADFYSAADYARWDENWCEALAARVQELPYNQELVSYERTRTAPTTTEIKTMDGAIRRYITGAAATMIRATFKWSDSAIASEIDSILEIASSQALPIVLYIPAGTYYNGPFLDLVVPSTDPTITMPAPGVYELTIEGACQP